MCLNMLVYQGVWFNPSAGQLETLQWWARSASKSQTQGKLQVEGGEDQEKKNKKMAHPLPKPGILTGVWEWDGGDV